jgi:flavin reductase (DIM6/NTAB) family NADH-FMN oxidoreductase RutF
VIKERLKSLVFPYYGPIGLHDPQREVEVWLRGGGEPIDVTYNNVVTALRPFTLGVMFDAHDSRTFDDEPRLCFHERGGQNRLLGVIHLRPVRAIPLPAHRFCLFETGACENYTVSSLNLRLYYFNTKRQAKNKLRKDPYNFQMTQPDLRSSFVFYTCPRPVVLVSVEHEESSNIFPMDLIGPTDSPWFSMALRSTSPAVRLMQQSRRMALASIPFTYKQIAYDLGKHHRKSSIDWTTLPFQTVPSPSFGLRVPEAALRIREVRVHEFHEVGSHVLFITSIEHETSPEAAAPREAAAPLQLFHIFGGRVGISIPKRPPSRIS